MITGRYGKSTHTQKGENVTLVACIAFASQAELAPVFHQDANPARIVHGGSHASLIEGAFRIVDILVAVTVADRANIHPSIPAQPPHQVNPRAAPVRQG
jgi:hypothetical protein